MSDVDWTTGWGILGRYCMAFFVFSDLGRICDTWNLFLAVVQVENPPPSNLPRTWKPDPDEIGFVHGANQYLSGLTATKGYTWFLSFVGLPERRSRLLCHSRQEPCQARGMSTYALWCQVRKHSNVKGIHNRMHTHFKVMGWSTFLTSLLGRV